MTLATLGRWSSQLSAIWGTVLPVSLAISSIASTTVIEVFVGDLRAHIRGRPCFCSRLDFGKRLAAADLAGEPSPAQRAPDDGADFLIERQRHELPFVVAADQRIIGLVGDVPCQAVPFRNRQRLHQVPARKVGAADVADLAGS